MHADITGNLPPSVYEALKKQPKTGTLKDIQHVVLLMQENRSFDHYFGDMSGVRGFGDRNAVRLRGGRSVFSQPYGGKGNAIRPFLLPSDGSGEDNLGHDWGTTHKAWNNGWHDKWAEVKGEHTMGYYGLHGVPIYRELAETFTVCDAYYSSVLGETTSNRNYWFSGYGGYEPDGLRVTGADAHDRECSLPDDREKNARAYQWSSYPEWLEANGVSWKVYQGWDNFYDNNLEFYAEFKRVYLEAMDKAGIFRKYGSLYNLYRSRNVADIQALNTAVGNLSKPDQQVFERGLRRYPRENMLEHEEGATKDRDFVQEFRKDIQAGALPKVSYLVPAESDSEHPAYHPAPGLEMVGQVLDALASNQEIWNSTVLLISYDENDGLFDHMPPPVPPEGVHDEWVGDQPIGLGLRVPMIVVSPWTTGGYVCSQVFDHTSQVRFLEKLLGVRQPWISRWRRTVAGDLTSVFGFTGSTGSSAVPQDRRRARPLPYQVDAYGSWTPQGCLLTMTNSGEASAHLTIYPYAGEYETPRHLDVLGTCHEFASVPQGRYDFHVIGPNGFRREFAGESLDFAAKVQISSAVKADPRQLEITVANHSEDPLTFVLSPLAYSETEPVKRIVGGGKQECLIWTTDNAHGWYDLAAEIEEVSDFHRRFMGHIENGAESLSG